MARTVRGRLLFSSWVEGLDVWSMVVRAVPHPQAICVMPDHVHVLAEQDVRGRLGRALGGLARRRNAQEGRSGPLVERVPPAVEVVGAKKRRRSLRYVHLNPCRAGLVQDPLEWPLSTHRDAVGLTWPRVGPRRRAGFHAYVSADPTTSTVGTELPGGALSAEVDEVLAAASSVLRVPVTGLRRPLARSLVEVACHELAPVTQKQLAARLGVGESTLRRRGPWSKEAMARLRRVVRDERFGPLDGTPLTSLPTWRRYRR